MAGTYVEGVSKVLSGVYTLIKSAAQRVTKGARGVVAYPFVADWGPVNVLTSMVSGKEFEEYFHPFHANLSAQKIYKHAYKGNPRIVQGYRMATKEAKKGEATLTVDSGSAMVLETLYPSSRPFTVKITDSLTDGAKVVDIIEKGVLLCSATGINNQSIADQLNVSDHVRVKTVGDGLPKNANSIAFTGGNDGASVTVTEYAAFLEEIEGDGQVNAFSLDAVVGTNAEALVETVKVWIARVRSEGFYITFVNGGPGGVQDWDYVIDDANAKSISFNTRAVVNVGNACDGYSAAEMAIFVAARVASVALNRTLTDETIPYQVVNKKLKPSQRETAKRKGTLVFVQNGDFVEIDEGVNTLTAPGDGESLEFGKIRVANCLDYIAKDLEAFGNEYKKTRSNTDEARQTYAATVEDNYLRPLMSTEVIQPGYFYQPDPEYHGDTAVFTPAIDEAYFWADITPVDSMERIYQKIGVSF